MGRARKQRQLEDALARALSVGIKEGERRTFERTLRSAALETLGLEVKDVRSFIERAGVKQSLPLIAEAARTTWPARYRERLSPVLGALMEAATEGKAPVLGSFTLQNPVMREYLDGYTSKLAATLSDTSYEKFEALLNEALEGGLSVPDAASLLEERIGELNKARAELIARTELNSAQNGAALEQAKRSGVVSTKTWLTAGDDRVRAEHVAMEGETVNVGDSFSNGLDAPGEPGCRCTVTFAVDMNALRGRVA